MNELMHQKILQIFTHKHFTISQLQVKTVHFFVSEVLKTYNHNHINSSHLSTTIKYINIIFERCLMDLKRVLFPIQKVPYPNCN